jgi:hypothetical protein
MMEEMESSTRGQPLGRIALLAVLLHLLVFVIAPFEHHDLLCHLKTPQHCTACAANPVGTDTRSLAVPGEVRLADAGGTVARQVVIKAALLAVQTPERSPPSHA